MAIKKANPVFTRSNSCRKSGKVSITLRLHVLIESDDILARQLQECC